MPVEDPNKNKGGNEGGDGGEHKEPVKFTDDQKEAINDIVEERLGRERRKHKDEVDGLNTKLTDALAKLETATKGKGKNGGKEGGEDGDDATRSQFERILNDQKQATKTAETKVSELTGSVERLTKENMKLRKDMAINEAADGLKFVNMKTVKRLVEDRIEWDDEKKSFVARTEDGQLFLNDSMKPGTLREFFSDFATHNDYLVNGKVVSGAGGSEDSKNGNWTSFKTKADFKSTEDKVAYIRKFGHAKYAALPVK